MKSAGSWDKQILISGGGRRVGGSWCSGCSAAADVCARCSHEGVHVEKVASTCRLKIAYSARVAVAACGQHADVPGVRGGMVWVNRE